MRTVALFLLFVVSCGHSTHTKQEYVRDPVCGMLVVKSRSNYQDRIIVFDDVKWYFCSDECMTKFADNPEKYMTTCTCYSHHDCDCYHCAIGPVGSRQPCVCKN